MLAFSFSTELISQVWNSLPEKTQLLCDHTEFCSLTGATPTFSETRRQHFRIHARGRAILIHGENLYGIYSLDISPNGIGLICPVQLFPCEKVHLRSDKCDTISLKITRCRRLGPKCYECGTVYIDGPLNPSTYNRLLDQLRD